MESSIDSNDLVQYAFNFGSFLCITHFTFVLGYQLLLYQMSGLQHNMSSHSLPTMHGQ